MDGDAHGIAEEVVRTCFGDTEVYSSTDILTKLAKGRLQINFFMFILND